MMPLAKYKGQLKQREITKMQPHTKIYFKHYNIGYYPDGGHDFIKCEVCGNKAVDIHHIDINRNNNNIENLIALCRRCHQDAHNGVLTKGDLHITHNSNL